MNSLFEKNISCPYCGETYGVLIDASQGDHEYIEDCYVCCRPIVFKVILADDEPFVEVFSEDEC